MNKMVYQNKRYTYEIIIVTIIILIAFTSISFLNFTWNFGFQISLRYWSIFLLLSILSIIFLFLMTRWLSLNQKYKWIEFQANWLKIHTPSWYYNKMIFWKEISEIVKKKNWDIEIKLNEYAENLEPYEHLIPLSYSKQNKKRMKAELDKNLWLKLSKPYIIKHKYIHNSSQNTNIYNLIQDYINPYRH